MRSRAFAVCHPAKQEAAPGHPGERRGSRLPLPAACRKTKRRSWRAPNHSPRKPRTAALAYGKRQPAGHATGDEVKEIGPIQLFAGGVHHDGFPELRDLIRQLAAFFRC